LFISTIFDYFKMVGQIYTLAFVKTSNHQQKKLETQKIQAI